MKKANSNKRRSTLRKILMWAIGLNLLVILFWGSYAGTGAYLRDYLTQTVKERSEGIYELQYERFDLLVWEMGFELKGFKLIPNLDLYEEKKKQGKVRTSLYEIEVPSCHLKGFNVLDLIRGSGVELKEVAFVKPDVKILAHIDSAAPQQERQYDDVAPIIRNLMEFLIIDHLVIDDGIFDLFIDQEDRIESFTASKISLDLSGFKVDNQQFGTKKFLYSESYELFLSDYKLNLADGVHTVEANEVGFSSADSSIFARGFNLSPGQVEAEKLDLLKRPYYHFFFPELMIKGADIQSAYLTDTLGLAMVHLQRPNFQIFSPPGVPKREGNSEFTGFSHNIYPLIQGYLKEVKIDSFLVGDGTFDFYETATENPENIEIEGISVSLEDLLVDTLSYLQEDNLLYAKQFWLNFEAFRMDLKDGVHQLAADSLFISSTLQSIKADGLKLYPREGISRNINHVDLSIPSIAMVNIDLIKAYHKNVLGASLFDLKDPVLKAYLPKQPSSRRSSDNAARRDLVKIVSTYFDTVSIAEIKLENGTVDFAFRQAGRMETLKGDQINISLLGFEIDSLAKGRKDRIFFSRHMDLEIHDYDFLLDQLHEVKVRNMKLSTRTRNISFRDIIFAPRDTSNVITKLKELKQTTLFDIHVPYLSYSGVDIFKLIYQDALLVDQVRVEDPQLNISIFPKPAQERKELKPILEKDIHSLVTSFFRKVQVNEVYAQNALINISKEPHKDGQFYTKAPLDLRLISFNLDKDNYQFKNDQFLFSDELLITLTDYDLDLGGPGHTLTAERIVFSTKDKRIYGRGIKVRPKKYPQNLFPFSFKFKADIPSIEAIGIDLKEFFEYQRLKIEKVYAEAPDIHYLRANSFSTGFKKAGKKNVSIKSIHIGQFISKNGRTSLHDEKGKLFMTTGFNGPIYKLNIDSASTGPRPTRFLTRHVDLDFSNGYFLFPDGLHKLEWDRLKVDQVQTNISLYGLKLFALPGVDPYRKLRKTQNSAYRSGTLKRLTISGLDADDFYSTGNIDIRKVTIQDLGLIEFVFPQLRKKTKIDLSNFKINLPKGIKNLNIQTIDLKNFHFSRYNVQGDSLDLVLDQGKIFGKVKGVRIRNGQKWDPDRIGFADDITLLVRNFKRKIPSAFMDISAKEIGISTGRNEAFVYDLHAKPWYGKFLHSRKIGYETDRIEAKVSKIFLQDLDIPKLYYDQYLWTKKLEVRDLWVEDHRDKRVEDRTGFYPPMPQELLKNMDFKFRIDSVVLTKGEIHYEEFVDEAKVPGTVNFLDMTASIANLSSDPEIFGKKPMVKMHGTAKLMGEGLIDFYCDLNVRDPGNKFEIRGTVGPMDMKKINPMVENVAFTTIKSGFIKSIEFDATADDHFCTGTMDFKYSDFKIALINKKTGQVEGFDKGFLSFLANTFVVNTRNPHLGFFREGSIFYKRNPNKAIINYWWKSLFTGIKTSIGAQNERKLHKIAEKTE